jgi:GNAT superfamily N-acetyltransferase
MSEASEPQVRPAAPADGPLIHALVRELADYEHLLHAMRATEADLAGLLFGRQPSAFCEIVELDGEPVGFSLWFHTVSTFEGRAGIHVEDLFVRPAARGRGAGRALLRSLARRCVAEGLGRLEWSVLDWNAPAIGFYDALGAERRDEWRLRRVTGEALRALAGD